MNTCNEFLLDDMMAVTAIPVTDYVLGIQPWQVMKTIPVTQFTPTLTNAIVIGQQPAVTGGVLIPIKRNTGKAKDSEDDSVAGRLHTVSVTCEADDRDPSLWEHLQQLEHTPSHLLLTFRGGQKAFAAATQDTYICEVERDGSKTSVSIKIYNLMGIQLITV